MHFQPSYWEQQSLLQPYDFLLIGSGLTGLHSALALKNKYPNKRIAILERAPFSAGASTRNAGFACFGNISEILDDLETMSEEETFGLMEMRYKGLLKTRQLLGDAAIGYACKGSHELLSESHPEDASKAKAYIGEANRLMKHFLGLENVFEFSSQSFGFKRGIGSINNAFEGQLHTGMLYTALRRKVVENEIEIFGGCEVKSWERNTNTLEVQLQNGLSFQTNTLILATNAFTADLLPKEDIVPARGQILLTEKIPGLNLHGIFHFDKGYYYWRDLDGRILLGGARNADIQGETTAEFGTNTLIYNKLYDFLTNHILDGKTEVKIAMHWSGIMAMGQKKKPIIAQVSPNVYLAARMGGMGVALSAMVAEELVALI